VDIIQCCWATKQSKTANSRSPKAWILAAIESMLEKKEEWLIPRIVRRDQVCLRGAIKSKATTWKTAMMVVYGD
jgi:hypothetical protein